MDLDTFACNRRIYEDISITIGCARWDKFDGGSLMVGMWITCIHCNEESLTATSLVEKGCCFHCYMKGKGPGVLR